MRIAVIGAGWAGLAAAVELTRRGLAVTLLEAGRVAGGRARRITVDGQMLDNGQHILLGAYRDTLALMTQVGLDPEKILHRLPLQVLDNAGFRLALPRLPAPFNLAWGLLTAKGVGIGEKIRCARWMDRIKRQKFIVDPALTVAAWLDQAGQTGKLRRHLWEPLCLAALNTPAERASAQLFANVLRDSLGSPRRADTDLLIPASDLGTLLPDAALHWLQTHGAEIRLGHRVHALQTSPEAVTIDGKTFAAAILATGPQHLAALWPDALTPDAYEPIATVYLQFSAKTNLPCPLINLHGGIGQWIVDRGDGLFAAVLSGHGGWETLDEAQLVSRLCAELGQPAPEWHKLICEKRATFSCTPGQLRPHWQTSHPRILLAGDHTWRDYPATLEGAVRSGLRAGRWLAERSKPA